MTPLGSRVPRPPRRPALPTMPRLSQAGGWPGVAERRANAENRSEINGLEKSQRSDRGQNSAVCACSPGKIFRLQAPKESVNHTDLPSIARGARAGARGLFRDLAAAGSDHDVIGVIHGRREGSASEAEADDEREARQTRPTSRRRNSRSNCRAEDDDHRGRRPACARPAAVPGPISSSASHARAKAAMAGGQARDLRRSARRAGQSVECRQRSHAISQSEDRARSARSRSW